MIRTIRSYCSSLKASKLFGRASRLRDAGQKEKALSVAHQALTTLRSPWIFRHRPAEGSVLLCATMLVEEMATELNQHGAENIDLTDALAYLKILPPSSDFEISDIEGWIAYFESRLKNPQGPTGGENRFKPV